MAYSITVDVSAIVDGQNADAADVTTPIANLKTAVQDLGNGVSQPEQFQLKQIATPSNPSSGYNKVYFKSDGLFYALDSSGSESAISPTVMNGIADGRLTLTTALPVTTSDVTAATTIYYTPYRGRYIALYNGTAWVIRAFTETTLSLAGLAANTPFDIWGYDNSGTLALESTAWTNDTTRATALTYQNGVLVKNGTTTRRYLGTIRTTGTIGQTEDSLLNRYVWNYYNRVDRLFYLVETTDSWTYATATFRPWNNSTANRFSFVRGVSEDAVSVTFVGNASEAGGVVGSLNIGLDSTSTPSGLGTMMIQTTGIALMAGYSVMPSAGAHYLQLMERASGATVTFYGDNGGTLLQSGAFGRMLG